MIRLSVCVEMVMNDLPFYDRIEKSAQMGFPAIEFWAWPGKDLQRIDEQTRALGIAVAGMTVATRDDARAKSMAQQGGLLAGKCASLFAENVQESIEAVKLFGKPVLIVTSGNELPDLPRQAQHDSLVECLRAAAPILEREGFTIVLEPLNPLVNHKGIYLSRSDEAFAMLDEVGSPNVKLLYDIYHQQITEGNLTDTIKENIGKIAHFHTADVPGRNEPGTGEINYRNVFSAIAATDYAGYVGLECHLTRPPEEALAWIMECAAQA